MSFWNSWFVLSLISNPYPSITLPKPPGCFAEMYGRDTADKHIFLTPLVSTGSCFVCVCVCLCKFSLLNHTIIVYFHKMEESTTVTSSIFKNRRISKHMSRYVTLHCTDAQARCFCQKVLIQYKFLKSLKCSWCCSVFDHSWGKETFPSHKPREGWHFCWSSNEHKTQQGAVSGWINSVCV